MNSQLREISVSNESSNFLITHKFQSQNKSAKVWLAMVTIKLAQWNKGDYIITPYIKMVDQLLCNLKFTSF